MYIRIFFCLFFSISSFLFSQNNRFSSQNDTTNTEIILGSNNQHFYLKNGDYILKKNLKNVLIESFLFKNKAPKKDVKLVFKNNEPVLVSRGGGMVWRVKNDTFKRVDQSFNHKMTNGSAVFVHNDTIMKFGGYGYWSSRSFFTYYDEITLQWEFYTIDKKSQLPPGVSSINSTYLDGEFYFSDGQVSNLNSPLISATNAKVWHFDFKNKSWSDLGTSQFSPDSLPRSLDLRNGSLLVKTVFDKKNDKSNILIYDYVNNSIHPWNNLSPLFSIESGFVANDSLYSYSNNQLFSVKIPDFKSASFDDVKLMFVDSDALFYILSRVTLIVSILLFAAVMFLYSKNRKRPRLSEIGFRFNRVHYPLSKNELLLLNLVLYSKRVESKTLLNKIYDPQLSAAQNNKIKIDLVDSLNEKIFKIMGVNSFISSKKSVRDQRVLIYYTKFRKDFVL